MTFFKEYKYGFIYGVLITTMIQILIDIKVSIIIWVRNFSLLTLCLYADYLYNNYRNKKEDK